jgi:hypothetical protein
MDKGKGTEGYQQNDMVLDHGSLHSLHSTE